MPQPRVLGRSFCTPRRRRGRAQHRLICSPWPASQLCLVRPADETFGVSNFVAIHRSGSQKPVASQSRMSGATWTNRFELTVRADLDSVVAWYASPDRRAESRAHFESFDVRDFRYDERVEGDRRTTDMSWITPAGLHVFLEIRGNVSNGVVARDEEGKVVRRGETYQYRRWTTGRQDRSRGETTVEFTDVPGGSTRVQISITRHKDTAPWWERLLPPITERRAQRCQLEEMFSRCERDLGSSPARDEWLPE